MVYTEEIESDSECNLHELATLLFQFKKQPGSIELGVEESQVDEVANGDFDKYMYTILIELFKIGTKKLYNIDNILVLTKQQVQNISEYFYAINYSIYVTANNSYKEPWTLLQQDIPLTSIEVHFKKIEPSVQPFHLE